MLFSFSSCAPRTRGKADKKTLDGIRPKAARPSYSMLLTPPFFSVTNGERYAEKGDWLFVSYMARDELEGKPIPCCGKEWQSQRTATGDDDDNDVAMGHGDVYEVSNLSQATRVNRRAHAGKAASKAGPVSALRHAATVRVVTKGGGGPF